MKLQLPVELLWEMSRCINLTEVWKLVHLFVLISAFCHWSVYYLLVEVLTYIGVFLLSMNRSHDDQVDELYRGDSGRLLLRGIISWIFFKSPIRARIEWSEVSCNV
jgi:hypothetical protein